MYAFYANLINDFSLIGEWLEVFKYRHKMVAILEVLN